MLPASLVTLLSGNSRYSDSGLDLLNLLLIVIGVSVYIYIYRNRSLLLCGKLCEMGLFSALIA